MSAVPQDEFRHLMAHWPSGVAVVTSASNGEPIGCTVSALVSVSLVPPLLLASMSVAGGTLTAIQERGLFGVNMLPADAAEVATRFAVEPSTGRFAAIRFHWVLGVPVLDDVVASAVCTVDRYLSVGDHVLVVGAPTRSVRVPGGEPVICYERGFRSLTPPAALSPPRG